MRNEKTFPFFGNLEGLFLNAASPSTWLKTNTTPQLNTEYCPTVSCPLFTVYCLQATPRTAAPSARRVSSRQLPR